VTPSASQVSVAAGAEAKGRTATELGAWTRSWRGSRSARALGRPAHGALSPPPLRSPESLSRRWSVLCVGAGASAPIISAATSPPSPSSFVNHRSRPRRVLGCRLARQLRRPRRGEKGVVVGRASQRSVPNGAVFGRRLPLQPCWNVVCLGRIWNPRDRSARVRERRARKRHSSPARWGRCRRSLSRGGSGTLGGDAARIRGRFA
jgi:hypothetical protein